MNFNINDVIDEMKKDKYPLFVSERHLQVFFIIKAKELYPKYHFIPEYVYHDDKSIYHIDLMVSDGIECIAIEFKYVVAGGTIDVPGQNNYKLRNHSAIDIRRYQCVRDINRLEKYLSSRSFECNKGYFVLITNMQGFWLGSKPSTVASEFDIPDNSKLKTGRHEEKQNTAFADAYGPIELENSYDIKYNDYFDLNRENGMFKSLVVEVKR